MDSASHGSARALQSLHKQGNLRISRPYAQLALKTTGVLSKSLFECHLRNLHIALVNYSITP
jgi:hypothetical protein